MPNVTLFNTSTNQVEKVPTEQVEDLVRAGTHDFISGSRIKVVNDQGQPGLIDSQDAGEAIRNGWQLDSPDKAADRKLRKEYGDKNIEAGVVSFLNGATLDLATPAMIATGLQTPESIKLLQEENPDVSFAGYGLGLGAGTIASMGEGLAAKTVGGAFKGLNAVGKATEAAVANTLKSAGVDASKSLAQKILTKMAPTVTGQAVEGGLIGAGQLLSEHSLGNADLNGENLLASAGFGATISGLGGALFQGAAEALPLIGRATKDLSKGLYNQTLAPEKATMSLLKMSEGDAIKLASRDHVPLTEFTNEINEIADRPGAGGWRDKFTAHRQETFDQLKDLYQKADNAVAETGIVTDDVIQKNKYVQMVQNELDQTTGRLEAGEASKLKALKSDLIKDEYLPNLRQTSEDGTSVLVKDEAIGNFQKAKGLLDRLSKQVPWGTPERDMSPVQKMSKKIWASLREDINNGIERIGKDPNLSPEMQSLFQDVRKINRKSYVLDKMQKFVDKMDVRSIKEDLINFKTAIKTMAIGSIGGIPGAALALGSRLMEMDGVQLAKIRLLSQIEKGNMDVQKRLQGSVHNFLSTGKQVGSAVRVPVVKGLTDISFNPQPPKKKEKETREQAFHRVTAELDNLGNPELLADLLQKRTQVLHAVAPETAGHLSMRLVSGIEFLRNHAPLNPHINSLNPALRKWKPSTTEIARFERYVRAVDDPMSVVERFSHGIVDREGVQALESVYPEIYASLQNRIMAEVAMMKEPLPYAKRLTIRSVFGISVDPTTDQESVDSLQKTFMQEQEPTQPQGSTKRPLELSGSLATPVEQIASI